LLLNQVAHLTLYTIDRVKKITQAIEYRHQPQNGLLSCLQALPSILFGNLGDASAMSYSHTTTPLHRTSILCYDFASLPSNSLARLEGTLLSLLIDANLHFRHNKTLVISALFIFAFGYASVGAWDRVSTLVHIIASI
jgi:hypothetical protein